MMSFKQYERTLERFSEMLEHWRTVERSAPSDRLVLEAAREALIQRFEYLVESSWKTCKKLLLETEGYSGEIGPKSLFRLAGGIGLLDTEKWIAFWDARLATSHDYDENKSLRLLSFADELEKKARLLLEAMRLKQASAGAQGDANAAR